MVVDYERSNFTVNQCFFSGNTTSDIVAIHPITTRRSEASLKNGAVIGIIVAAVVVLLLLATGGYIYYVKTRRKRRENSQRQAQDRSELARVIAASQNTNDMEGIYEAFAPKPVELGNHVRRVSELQAENTEHEMQGDGLRAELPVDNNASAYRLNEMD